VVDIANVSGERLKAIRRDMQIIFQDPYSSLNPHMSVGAIIAEPLQVHGLSGGSERRDRVQQLLQAEFGLTYLFIAHDLAVVKPIKYLY
jgi:ABC-type microcin C transport system duplicated ATPase subunit YejF